MSCKLIALGTKGGPRIVKDGSWPTSTLLDIDGVPYIIDCGLGVTRQMANAGYALKQLAAIYITHFHSDHTLELGALLHTAWCSGLNHPVNIYGPVGVQNMIDGFLQSQKIDIETRVADEGLQPLGELLHVHEFSFSAGQEGLVSENASIKVKALKNVHPPMTESYAYKFETVDKKIVLSGDTSYYPPLADFARGADLLVHEVLLQKGLQELVDSLKDTKPGLEKHLLAAHTFASDVGKIASQADVKHLAFNHCVPCDMFGKRGIDEVTLMQEVRTTWQGKTTVCHDGTEILI